MITLAELANTYTQDKIAQGVINEISASNFLMETMPFDNCVSPSGGSDLVYGYTRVTTPSTAKFRAIGEEYTADNAKAKRFTTTLGILGGTYNVDRVVAKATNGALISELDFQLAQKKLAVVRGLSNAIVNGDTSKDANGFDGLSKALKNSSTEVDASVDVSTAELMTSNKDAFADEMDSFLAMLARTPDALIANKLLKTKMNGIARRLGIYTQMQSDAGKKYDSWAGIPVVDIDDVIAVTGGTTDLYAVCFGSNEFHGITLDGGSGFDVEVPDFTTSGSVKEGSVELVCSVALKATKAAGVLRGVKVSAVPNV